MGYLEAEIERLRKDLVLHERDLNAAAAIGILEAHAFALYTGATAAAMGNNFAVANEMGLGLVKLKGAVTHLEKHPH